MDNSIDDNEEEGIKSVSIDEDDVTGEVIATTTKVVKGPDGTKQTIKTTERFKKGTLFSIIFIIPSHFIVLKYVLLNNLEIFMYFLFQMMKSLKKLLAKQH